MSKSPLKYLIPGFCAALFAPAMADQPGSHPGDDAMTCAQIAGELAPYMARIQIPAQALARTSSEVVARGKQHVAEETPAAVGLTAAATASTVDATGVSSRAVGQAEVAHQREVWNRTQAEDKPLADKQASEASALMAQAQQMQNDPRLNRLMQLAQQKGCDKQP